MPYDYYLESDNDREVSIKHILSRISKNRNIYTYSSTGKSIKKELSQKAEPPTAQPGTFPNETTGKPELRRVILDSSYMTKADRSALWGWLNDNLTADELSRIVEVNTQL